MKKLTVLYLLFLIVAQGASIQTAQLNQGTDYQYPKFYKGVYINVSPHARFSFFKHHIDKAVKYGMNTVVLDTWHTKAIFKQKHFDYCKLSNIHMISRIVMFDGGLKYRGAVNIKSRLRLVELAAKAGFKEIQLDYVRFSDRRSKVSSVTKAKYIENIVYKAKRICQKYNVKLSVDVFGRIPFTKNDRIGQRIEQLDRIADVICPMAYPSYYGKGSRNNEYALIKKVIKKSKSRVKNAKVVLWIQGFKHKNLKKSYYWFIHNQIKAVKDAGGDGFIIWNSSRNYKMAYAVMNNHFNDNKGNGTMVAMR